MLGDIVRVSFFFYAPLKDSPILTFFFKKRKNRDDFQPFQFPHPSGRYGGRGGDSLNVFFLEAIGNPPPKIQTKQKNNVVWCEASLFSFSLSLSLSLSLCLHFFNTFSFYKNIGGRGVKKEEMSKNRREKISYYQFG